MITATWNGETIAQSTAARVVDGAYYFPREDVQMQFLRPSEHTSLCSWKGTAKYYDVEVAGQLNPQAAWYYEDPTPAAHEIKDHVAFWKGVKVEEMTSSLVDD